MIGKIVSHYRVLDRLGEGGMGEVYLAEDTHLGRRVAIKFPSVTANEHDYRARFLREARAISELSNPNIATLFDYGETGDGQPFLVMEFVRGQTLHDMMRKGELTLPRALQIIEDIASALSEAHNRGIVHRDIKPSNIMVDERGQIKVLDFGLVKQLNDDQIHLSEPEAQTLLAVRTRSGMVLGTPAYLSPEQAMGTSVDPRSDLFALGGVLYECVTGRSAFPGSTVIEIAAKVIHVDPVIPSKVNSSIPSQLDSVILKALAKSPAKRYQSAAELKADLRLVRELLQDDSGPTIIKSRLNTSELRHRSTLAALSQTLRRKRVPLWYILVGLIVLLGTGWTIWRWRRPALHIPPAEARNWLEIGTNALRDGAYFQASKALEQAIAIDDKYVLAHARMSEALLELDYVDRAKDELLRVTALVSERSGLPKTDELYVTAISATVRHDFPAAIESYAAIAQEASDIEKPRVLVDLGRAYEKNEELPKAIAVYLEATSRNPQYATAFLHLGILHGRQRELTQALDAFAKAEEIYQAMGNLEGRTEAVYQRGALFNQLQKLAEARAELARALALAEASDNASQKIRTLLQLSAVAVDAGETTRATDYAQDAVSLAQRNGMENLAAQGLIDMGYGFLVRGEPVEAEKYFLQALDAAQRAKARSNEARARGGMASLRQQQNRPDEVVKYLEPALAFYQQGNYRAATSSCLALLARANLQKGDYQAAQKAQEQLLQLGQQLHDQSMIAQAHAERGSALAREEKYTEALDHLSQAYQIYNSQGIQRSVCNNLVGRALVLSHLGRYSEAQILLDQASAIADKPGGEMKRLSLEVKVAAAEVDLGLNNFSQARDKAEKLLALSGNQSSEISARGNRILGLALVSGGALPAGKDKSAAAVEMAKQLNDPWQLAMAQLDFAEAMLLSGAAKEALSSALQARAVFAKLGQVASEGEALAVAASASSNLNDESKAREYALQANNSFSTLEQRWGTDSYKSYLSRPDVLRLRKHLDQLASSAK